MRFLQIGPFHCPRVALDGAFGASGLPGMTAIAGWVDQIARSCGHPALNPNFAIVLHDLQRLPGIAKASPTSNAAPGEVVERIHGRLKATIVIADHDAVLGHADVLNAVRRARFCGSLFEGARVRERDTIQDALLSAPPGHVLTDRTDLLSAACADATDPLDALLDVLWAPVKGGEENPWSFDETGAWRQLLPLSIGYQLLEQIDPERTRAGSRSPDTPHVFAEGVVGLGEAVSSRRIARAGLTGTARFFWSWEQDNATGLLAVTGKAFDELQAERNTL